MARLVVEGLSRELVVELIEMMRPSGSPGIGEGTPRSPTVQPIAAVEGGRALQAIRGGIDVRCESASESK